MGSGPILIFDKSLLEALSPDESVWLGQLYNVNVTPVFLIETLADLEKVDTDRDPRQAVARLAEKTSVMMPDPNQHHSKLCAADLLGNEVQMKRFVVLGPGRPVKSKDGTGIVYDLSEEAKFLERWQTGKFLDAERDHAKAWRAAIEELDLESLYRRFKPIAERDDRPRNLQQILARVRSWLNDSALTESMLGSVLEMLRVPFELWPAIVGRWKAKGKPLLPSFAPYAAHVYSVDLFFAVALATGHISKDRATNQIDISYLYYLPFCMVFASMDNLHARTVPLFLRPDQAFIWGADLKADLKRLDAHYSELPDDIKARGVMSFAHAPPHDTTLLTTRLWDQFMGTHWREPRKPRIETPEEAAKRKEWVESIKQKASAPATSGQVSIQDASWVLVESKVPRKMGKWQIVPPDAE